MVVFAYDIYIRQINFQGVFISIKIDPKFLWGLIYELKHIQEPPPLSCQQSQTSSIDNAIFYIDVTYAFEVLKIAMVIF